MALACATHGGVFVFLFANLNQIGTVHCIPALRRIRLLLLIIFLHRICYATADCIATSDDYNFALNMLLNMQNCIACCFAGLLYCLFDY